MNCLPSMLAVVCVLSSLSPAAATTPLLREGARFPDLLLPDLESGELKTLKAFRGKKVLLLNFASW